MFHQASNSCHQIFIGVCFRIFGSFGSHDIEIIPVLQDIVGLVEKIDPLGRGRLNFSEFCRGMQAVMQGGPSKTMTYAGLMVSARAIIYTFEDRSSDAVDLQF